MATYMTADAAERAALAKRKAAAGVLLNPTAPAKANAAAMARIYDQRIPRHGPPPPPAIVKLPSGTSTRATTSNTRVGPGGTTMADVARVAGVTSTTPSAPQFDQRKLLANMIGGPSPVFGEQYGGMPSKSMFEDLIRGDFYNIDLARQMAQAEADRLAAPIEEQYAIDVDPTKALGMAGKNLREAQKILGTGTPTRINGTTVNVGSLEALARQMAGGTPSAQDLYGANMARINAVRGTGDYMLIPDEVTGQLRPTTSAEQVAANAAKRAQLVAEPRRDLALQRSGATAAQELVNAMSVLTPSEMLQEIAINKYGVDPALAAGMFPVSENLAYQEMQNEAYKAQIMQESGFSPDDTVAEIILYNYGVDALREYQLQQAEYAMSGTPTQQLSALKNEQEAEDAIFDENARNVYGVDPGRVSGVDPQFMRDLLENQTFVDILTQARADIIQEDKDPLTVSTDRSTEYANATGDLLGAKALGQIIANFNLQTFG